jgi:tRNA(Ile2) C34 agmatinyltransferase TiaS
MVVATQWLGSDQVGIPTDMNAAMETATGEQCFLCDTCRGIIKATGEQCFLCDTCRGIIKQDSWSNELVEQIPRDSVPPHQ